MTKEELDVLNSNDWNKCIQLIEDYWNIDYGTVELCKEKDGKQTLELTTGGWSENEDLIDQIANTWFWLLWWQESKRGGYYKFIYTNKINYKKGDENNDSK